jgi:aquaporin Z
MTSPMTMARPHREPWHGWHPKAYLAEFAGTALILAVGLSAVTLDFGAGSPVPHHVGSAALRRLITGTIFASAGAFVVYSRLGRRSGGHFNPAVTLAFHRLGKVTTRDAVAYVVAQTLGAVLGAFVVWAAWGAWARSVHVGATVPGPHGRAVAFAAELLMAFALVTLILQFVAHMRVAHWTPVAAGMLAATLVVLVAPISGTSINPARSFGPAVWGHELGAFWIYLLAPPLGALLAVLVYRALGRRTTPCAKLFHTDDYVCHFVGCQYQRPSTERSATT